MKLNDPKSKENCFHCGVVEHWKGNCPNYLPQKNDSNINKSLIIEVSFIAGTSNT